MVFKFDFDIATSKMKNIFCLVAKTIMNISYRLHIYTFISDNNKGVQTLILSFMICDMFRIKKVFKNWFPTQVFRKLFSLIG